MTDFIKNKFFDSKFLGICVKDVSKKVLFQNDVCTTLCGMQLGNTCSKLCMKVYRDCVEGKSEIGSQYFANQKVGEKVYDFILIHDGKLLTTLVLDLNSKIQTDREFFRRFDLTQQETKILKLVLQGLSNKEIATALFISPATLRNHLNHIYKKIPRQLISRTPKETSTNQR